ncbi:hypothetical protein D6827_00290 [Candidatus Parcubacteria bacterium]|nr:MAG: hypothetical protein D6827_00290 [Candidatus Parcubacteria bacterium]
MSEIKIPERRESDNSALRAEMIEMLKSEKPIIKIGDIAKMMGLSPVEKTLPNGRVIKTIEWKPDHLGQVYDLVNSLREESGLGNQDSVMIDGACPTWLLPTISHAFHPTYTSVRYPQGGPEASIPLSGAPIEGEGSAPDMQFEVKDGGEATIVEFSLTQRQIDLENTIANLTAPEVPSGKPVHITGRGPIAIATALAEAYSHNVPYVANFQPGTGFVVSISHDKEHPVGMIIE